MAEERAKGIRVFLVDDHVVVRRGIARIVQGEDDMEVVGEAGDGGEAVQAVLRLRPDVVLMDIGMPTVSGIDAARQIHEAVPDSRVLMLTVYDQEDILFRALQAGASGYVLKGATVDEVLRAIRTVYAGEVFIHPSMTAKLVRDYLNRLQSGDAQDESAKLSAREREVLPLLAEGLANQEIAQRLHISPYTVQTYCQRIMEKLDLHSRTELLKYALRKGLIRLE
ncbi:MAG: response regulator transcription factor [Chloroflexi bacterium]|nr:response regulator transcription factor [Chloroflexota bacterium]